MQIFYSVAVSLLALYWWVYFGVLRSGFFIFIGGITNTENETEEAVYLRTGKN